MEPLANSPDSSDLGTTPGPQLAVDTPKPSGRDTARVAFEWIGLVVLALIIALLIKTFLFQAFYIPSESMEPALKPGDRVLVNKLSYHFHDIHRGDIIPGLWNFNHRLQTRFHLARLSGGCHGR